MMPRPHHRFARAIHYRPHVAARRTIEHPVADHGTVMALALDVHVSDACSGAEAPANATDKPECRDDPTTAHAEAILAAKLPAASPVKAVMAVTRINPAVPAINVMPSCRGAAILGGQHQIEVCLQSENTARTELSEHWAEFASADRSNCTSMTTLGGGGTYTSLLTCLEMRRDARSLATAPSSMIAASH